MTRTDQPASAAVPGVAAQTLDSAPPRTPGSLLHGLIRLARPRQWVKNVLVFAAPGTAGVLDRGDALQATTLGFLAFCLVASGTYYINDVLDRHSDSAHPRKRLRPVASGAVPVPLATVVGTLLLVAGLAVALAARPLLLVVVGAYVAITLSYSSWLKHIEVVDLVAVSSGFLLRAVAGGVAAEVPLSDWFLIVASFGSIFLVAGKRHAEHVDLEEGREKHRVTLARYSLRFLGHVRAVSSAVAILAYCLWALETGEGQSLPWFPLSIVPFVLAMLRYELLIEEGRGGAPEEVFMSDRSIQVFGLLWVGLVMAGVYAG